MLICSQFIAKDLILWSKLFFCVFWKIKFFWLLGPSKKTHFWILDLWECLKKLGLEPTVLKILSCIYCLVSTLVFVFSDYATLCRQHYKALFSWTLSNQLVELWKLYFPECITLKNKLGNCIKNNRQKYIEFVL